MGFETLVLSRKDLNLLRLVSRKPVDNSRQWAEKLDTLIKHDFVGLDYFENENGTVVPMLTITSDGKDYLNYIFRRQLELHISTALSAIAILISLFALFRTA